MAAGEKPNQSRMLSNMFSEIFGQEFQFLQCAPRTHRTLEAMLDVVVDEFALGAGDGFLDRMKLLREIETASILREHVHNGTQMSLRAFEALDDGGVAGVLHDVMILSSPMGYGDVPSAAKAQSCDVALRGVQFSRKQSLSPETRPPGDPRRVRRNGRLDGALALRPKAIDRGQFWREPWSRSKRSRRLPLSWRH